MKILIVGLGLLGGSYAMALKKKGYCVRAITKEQNSIDFALEHGYIDEGADFPDKRLIGEADIIICALYPNVFLTWIEENQNFFKSGAIITDVTGVKQSVVYKLQAILREDVEFIAAHPMAGREVSGVENSDDRIFEGANYIVVPTDKNTEDAIELCSDLGEVLGFKSVSILSPEKHDEMIAFLSQLTHCIAVSLMCTSDDPDLVKYTGDSFRDLTRIATINDAMWSELFSLNKDSLIKQMDNFTEQFLKLRESIENDDIDTMRQMMVCSTERRRRFNKR